MGLGKNIQKLRINAGLTQKDLAEKLFVTAQAVSRWEQEIVEPNIQTLRQMSEIFGVSIDDIIVDHPADEVSKEEVVDETKPEPVKQILSMCDTCHKPIYVGDEVKDTKTKDGGVIHECVECYEKRVAAEEARIRRANYNKRNNGIKRRTTAIVISSIVLTIGVALSIVFGVMYNPAVIITAGIIGTVLFSLFLYIMIVANSFVPDMWRTVGAWGFVQFPGLIFELSLDGIIWLLTVKLLFWILGYILAFIAIGCATVLGMILSPFVFPYALTKSIKHPELCGEE